MTVGLNDTRHLTSNYGGGVCCRPHHLISMPPTPDDEFAATDYRLWLPRHVGTCTSSVHLPHKSWLHPRIGAASRQRGLDLHQQWRAV
jgi:hypothetical protein